MRGVVLAGGHGKRLEPMTKVINKHCLPVAGLPMLYWPLKKISELEIRETLIVTGCENLEQIVTLVQSGKEFGLDVEYKIQTEAGGIAQALRLAKKFVDDDPFVVILGDNIFTDSLKPYYEKFLGQINLDLRRPQGMLLLKYVVDPERFGVGVVKNNKLIQLIEKPSAPSPSKLAITGIYFYVGKQIFDMIDRLIPSERGELEITSLNSKLLEMDTLSYNILSGEWSDAGLPSSLYRANQIMSTGENNGY